MSCLLINKHGLHILLFLELKRSKKDTEIAQQLKASERFMCYVVDTAERICHLQLLFQIHRKRILDIVILCIVEPYTLKLLRID